MLQISQKVAQQLLQNLYVDFHIFYKLLLISPQENLVSLHDSRAFNNPFWQFAASVHYLTQQSYWDFFVISV